MSELKLTHIGGPTVLLEVGGWRLLTDPTFDPPGGSYRFGWGTGSRKLAGPAIAPEELGPIDAVLLSHDHHEDNLDGTGRKLLGQAGAVITTVPGAKRLGGETRGLRNWETTTLEGEGRPPIKVTATPCRHGPPLSKPIVSDVIGFGLSVEGPWEGVIWVSGDTVLYPGVREVADRLDVDVALVHLGGVQFPITGPLHYTMTAKQALELCAEIKPRVIVPIHYEGWEHFREGRQEVEREFANGPADLQRSVHWLTLGETVAMQR